MSNVKQHHYLPIFYLSEFTNHKGKVFVLDKAKHIRNQLPREVAKINYYYSMVDKYGIKHNVMEEFLSEIENQAADIFKIIKAKETITDEQRINFSFFLTLMQVRVPKFRNQLESLIKKSLKQLFEEQLNESRLNNLRANFEKQTGKKLPIGNIDFEIPNALIVKEIFIAASQALEILVNQNWIVLSALEDAYFITSDNPFITISKTEPAGLATVGAIHAFPLTPNMAILCSYKGLRSGYKNAKKEEVQEINNEIIRQSQDLIVSHSRLFSIDC